MRNKGPAFSEQGVENIGARKNRGRATEAGATGRAKEGRKKSAEREGEKEVATVGRRAENNADGITWPIGGTGTVGGG